MSYQGKKIAVLIPAYNEEKYIGTIIDGIPSEIDKIIVIDDGSDDNTLTIAKEKGVYVIENSTNRGYSYSLKRGYHEALKSKMDVIVHMDGDGQHKPDEIWKVVNPIINNDADYVLGSRLLNNNDMMPIVRYWGNRLISCVAGFCTGFKISDATTGFTAISVHALRSIGLSSFGNFRWNIDTDLIINVAKYNKKLVEVPISCIYADEDSNLAPISDAILYTIQFIKFLITQN